MPIVVPVDGSPPFAMYPAILGPERRGRVNRKDSIRPTVDEFDDALTLFKLFEDLEFMTVRLFGNDRVGRKQVQQIINWMCTVGDRMEFRDYSCDAQKFGGRWLKPPIERTLHGPQDELEMARNVCGATEKWYSNDHGTPEDHQGVVNALTLSFRL
jgi:hypothetical protein